MNIRPSEPVRAEWRFQRPRVIDRIVSHLGDFAELAEQVANRGDRLYRDVRPALLLAREIREQDALWPGCRDYDALEADLVKLAGNRGFTMPRRGSGIRYGEDLARETVLEQHGRIVDVLRNFRRVVWSEATQCIHLGAVHEPNRTPAPDRGGRPER